MEQIIGSFTCVDDRRLVIPSPLRMILVVIVRLFIICVRCFTDTIAENTIVVFANGIDVQCSLTLARLDLSIYSDDSRSERVARLAKTVTV